MIEKETEQFSKVSEWIRERQSIYPAGFTGELISDTLIKEILLNANAAPSHRNTEPWRFKIVRPASKDSFSDFCQAAYKLSNEGPDFKERKYNKIKSKISTSSHILIITMQRDETGSVPEWEEIAAVACAVQNIYLSLAPLGLGGYWSSPGYVMSHISDYVRLESGESCLGLFYLGVADTDRAPQIVKGEIDEKLLWI